MEQVRLSSGSLVTIRHMAKSSVSQKTIVEVMRVLREYGSTTDDVRPDPSLRAASSGH